MKVLKALLTDQSGASLVEYALVVALVAIMAITAAKFLAAPVSRTIGNAAAGI